MSGGQNQDLLAMLGVELPPPVVKGKRKAKAEVKPVRHTEWNNNSSFLDAGYVARLTSLTCETCGSVTEVYEGVYHAELHQPSRTRRLQALGRGAQWPAIGEHRLEITYGFTLMCGACVRGLGFSREFDAAVQPYQLIIKE